MGTEFLLSNENILEFTMVMVVQLGDYTQTTELYTSKRVNLGYKNYILKKGMEKK